MENLDGLKFYTPQELLELLRRMHDNCSDYRLAKLLGLTQTSIHRILKQGGSLSDETAIALAEELSLPPSYVVICVHLDRAKDEKAREAWEDVASKMLRASCFVLAGYLLHYAPAFLMT